jgi:hypothetical protein
MNIFVVDNDPIVAAKMLCDSHVCKMILEGCQMLSTVHSLDIVQDNKIKLYKPCFHNHPCTIWARASKSNYYWLANHTFELTNEYSSRYYGKIHKSTDMAYWFTKNAPSNLPNTICTDFAQAMPDQYKNVDGVTAYRAYYLGEKAKFAKWKLGNEPMWFTSAMLSNNAMLV